MSNTKLPPPSLHSLCVAVNTQEVALELHDDPRFVFTLFAHETPVCHFKDRGGSWDVFSLTPLYSTFSWWCLCFCNLLLCSHYQQEVILFTKWISTPPICVFVRGCPKLLLTAQKEDSWSCVYKESQSRSARLGKTKLILYQYSYFKALCEHGP